MHSPKSRGFSALELMVVVALALVVGAAAVPNVQRSLAGSRLQSAIVQLEAEINFARTMAVSRNAVYRLQLNPGQGTYQIMDADDPENPPRAPKRLETGIFFRVLPQQDIQFLPRGGARPGALELGDDWGRWVTLTVGPSGMVEIQEFESYEHYGY